MTAERLYQSSLRSSSSSRAERMTTGQNRVGKGGESSSMPQCYSTLTANPSIGTWRECEGGAEECSPVDLGYAARQPWLPEMEQRCKVSWESDQRGAVPMPYWTWEASECRLNTVDAESFCRVMEGRKGILFVGDSLTGQTVDTLASILNAESLYHQVLAYDKFSACNGALKFSWYRNDFLDPRTTESGGFESVHCEENDVSMSRCVVFADDAILSEFDTLVVNAGAHRRVGGIDAYGDMMKNASEVLTASMKRLHGNDAIMIVRNTVPGHGDGHSRMFDGPVDVDTANDIVAAGPPIYGWTSFPDKNKLLEEAFGGAGWNLLDAYTPTLLRVDSHGSVGDGLHYCVPGPVDHWITLLYNILLVETNLAASGG
ncbi:unnamed protein product [Pylaiella littoralis]